MNLNSEVLGEFLDLVGKSSLSKYVATHGAPGNEGLERSLRWAAWNFRKGERTREACFLMAYQNELRAMLDVGEQAYLDEADIHRGLNSDPTLAEPDVRIQFDEEDEDVEDAYSFGSAAGFSFRPPNMREEPLPERDGFLDAARLLVENAALQDSGLSSSLDGLNIDDEVPEDSKDLLTFGTVAVDAPHSPGWVPPPTDDVSVMSTRAPVFLDAAEPVLRSPQAEPVFEAREVVTDLPPPDRVQQPTPNEPLELHDLEPVDEEPATGEVSPDEEATKVADAAALLALSEQTTTAPQVPPKTNKLPMVLGVAGIAVLVAAVSVAVTLTTLQVTATDPVATPTPVPVSVEPANDGIADAVLPEPALTPEPVVDVAPDVVEPENTEPENTEPEVVEPEPEATQPEPETVEPEPVLPEPEAPEPEATQPEPETTQPEPAAVVPEVTAPEPQPEPEVAEPEPAPAPAAPSMVGSWRGTGGSGAMQLVIDSQNGNTVSGRVIVGAEESRSVAGQLDPATGAVTLSEIGGSATFSGTLTGSQANGTWRAAPGTAARQWFVVKQ